VKISHKELQQFTFDLLCSAGVDAQEALIIAKIFIWFDLIGRYTQGVGRLHAYLKRVRHGLIKSPCHPEFVQKSETIFIVNGNDGFGHYLGHIAMSKAIEIANIYGIGMVGVHQSNHFGAGAYYVQMAAEDYKMGLAFSNAVPKVAPYGGITATLGTNPFAFGAPTRNGQSILVDLSTGASSGSMIMKAEKEGKNISEGILIDGNGDAIVDPRYADQGVILPFGGAKGFCLGLMVEILSGVITSSGISHEIASMHKNFERSTNVGNLFLAIDIAKMMHSENYFDRMDALIGFIKNAKKRKGVDEILMPGETRWRNYKRQLTEGIRLELNTIASLNTLAKELNVPLPW
jgi:LDH2 family malate/lactate/ureidoglycolate dehydrogenase